MKPKHYVDFMAFFIALSILLCASSVCAEMTFRERIRERIRERLKAKSSSDYGSGDYDFSLAHDGLTRKYKVHLPPSYDGSKATPVVIYLHGGGGSIKAAYKEGIDKFSDKYGFILAVPAGTGLFPDRLLVWNGGKWQGGECCGYAVENNIDDVGFISKMIEELKREFNVDEKRIYATGISNGGLMSYRLACELSKEIAAIAPIAPPAVPQNCTPSRPIPVMHIHGTADPCARFNGGRGGGCLGGKIFFDGQSAKEMVDKWIKINNCSADFTTVYKKGSANCISYSQCKDGSEVEFCTVEGGGHTYPSGNQYLPVSRIGPVSYDISFDQIWEFFKRHPMKNISHNKVNSVCGNDICEKGEDRFSCRKDCGINPPPYHPEKLKTLIHYNRPTGENITRTYLLYVPSCYKKRTPISLVLNFHGGGGSAEAAEIQIGSLNKKAEEACFIAVHPNGVSAVGIPGKRQYWNSGSARTDVRSPDIDDVGFISALLDKLAQEYSLDTKRIYATGLSNGAQMSYRLACELSEKIAAIAPIGAGMVVKECNPKHPVSVMHFHGTEDPGWPYYGGSGCFTNDKFEPVSHTISRWMELNQCHKEPHVTYQKGDVLCETYDGADNSEVTLCTIEGGGHVYPGPDAYVFPIEQVMKWDEDCALGSGRGVGKITPDISAKDAMWEFFKRHPKIEKE